jgi:serine protease Do
LQRVIALHEPGDEVRVAVVRFGTPRTFRLRLRQAPVPDPGSPRVSPVHQDAGAPALGLELDDHEPGVARRLGFTRPGGVLVADVVPYGAADRKGVAPGQRLVSIDRAPVHSARQAKALLRAARRGTIVTLTLESGSGRTYIANVRVP